MELDAEELSLIELFRERAADKRRAKLEAETMERDRDEEKHKEEHRKREEKEEKEREEIVRATTAQIEAFEHRLDDYDTATVHALMINQEQLDAVRLQLDQTEAAAFHLPDGRAVFRTADGRHVYDKTGAEVSDETVHPDEIPNTTPTWDVWQGQKAVESDLLRQRDEIHAFQHRVDQAREQCGQKSMTADALAKIDDELKASMPQPVREAQAFPGERPERARLDIPEVRRDLQPFQRPASAPIAQLAPI